MVRVFSLCLVFACFHLSAYAETVIFPAELADFEGIHFSQQGVEIPVGLWPDDVSRAHAIYDSTAFDDLNDQGLIRITEFNLRPDGAASVGSIIGFKNLKLAFAVTSADTNEISRTFTENLEVITSDLVTAYNQPWESEVRFPVPAEGTRPFDFKIELTSPFVFDPTAGNLFVEWNIGRATHPSTRFDFDDQWGLQFPDQTTTFALGNAPRTRGPFGVVTQFNFESVPEPNFNLPLLLAVAVFFGQLRVGRNVRICSYSPSTANVESINLSLC